ncbi:Dol-P-Glc:Glc(1)Man(9)GlcNAc(2)-PP-dolichyl alpha-1,3-glucosyltransferase [Saitozyma sp. JCM 24511]|nr:Dol-P-Glc:Glc(1)Man(9)GlcNAc(2)-PP-dolichyl alpha-1,3-glucosyltransferase [Saitozyma sp. JCM 24511]
MLGLTIGQRDLFVATTALKVLLFPAYRSTDFEVRIYCRTTLGERLLTLNQVHRNWLAITHNLPLKQWYYETTSEWSEYTPSCLYSSALTPTALDYPPFFAYFSYLLSLPAKLLPEHYSQHLLQLSRVPVEGWAVVGYMRISVLVTEVVLFWSLLRLSRSSNESSPAKIVALAIAFHPGFLILDAIHFQYNGFLFGLMIWSLAGAKEASRVLYRPLAHVSLQTLRDVSYKGLTPGVLQGRPLMCAAFFAALLNFKHIYVYLAPAWFIYLLRTYCIPPKTGLTLRLKPLVRIGTVVIGVTAVSLGPFLYLGQGQQLVARLFPFTRGLMHAYWAPNQVAKRFRLDLAVSSAGVASTSRGLVGDTNFAVIPDITPLHCFILTGLTQVVQLVPLWRRPSYKAFLQAIAACGFSSFMFGWHVHEKAVMLVLLAAEDWNHYQAFFVASVSGIIGLFPLLFKAAETPVKMGYSFIWLVVVCGSLRSSVPKPTPTIPSQLLDNLQTLYLSTAPVLLLFTSVFHPVLSLSGHIPPSMEFLPLMLTSVWCSLGLWIAWGRLNWGMWRGGEALPEVKIE